MANVFKCEEIIQGRVVKGTVKKNTEYNMWNGRVVVNNFMVAEFEEIGKEDCIDMLKVELDRISELLQSNPNLDFRYEF